MRLFASGQRSLFKQIMASNLDLFDCSHINTAKQQVFNEALRVAELSYLGPLNEATFRAEPEQRQIGINDWVLTMWLRCLSVTYGMTSSSTYYYTKAMTDLFVNTAGESGVKFQSISTMADFWTVSFPPYSFRPCSPQWEITEKWQYEISSAIQTTSISLYMNSTHRAH